MKKLLAGVLLCLVAMTGFCQSYPINNPTYIPTASGPSTTYAAPATYVFNSAGLSVATLRVTGTCTSLAATVQGSNDLGANWTNLNAAAVAMGASTRSISAPGFWKMDVGGFNQLRLNITALSASCTVTMAGTAGGFVKVDPCEDVGVMRLSKIINQGASATTKVVDAVAGTSIYVCGFSVSAAGTNPTFTITSGTHTSADCDTTAALLSGAITPSATVGVFSLGEYGGTILSTAASFQLCLTTAATTSVQGVLTYVQQ